MALNNPSSKERRQLKQVTPQEFIRAGLSVPAQRCSVCRTKERPRITLYESIASNRDIRIVPLCIDCIAKAVEATKEIPNT